VGGATAVALVVVADEGVRGVYYGLTAGAAAALVTNLVLARRALALRFSAEQLRRLVAFGGPLVLSALGGWSLVLVDRVILAQFVSLPEVGFYGLANRLAGVLLIATYAFGTAWAPYILGLHAEDPRAEARIRADVLRHWLAGTAVMAVLVAAVSREAVEIIAGAEFVPAAEVIPVLALAYLLFATLTVTQTPFLIEHRTGEMARLSIVAAVVNIGACFVLIPPWGIHGAAIATVAGFGFQAAAYYRRSQQRLPAPYDGRRMATAIGMALPFLAVGWIDVDPVVLGVVLKVAAAAAFAVLLVVLRIVDLGRLRAELKMVFSG
jgi:O-antigen/teichoic acid export membrane protein